MARMSVKSWLASKFDARYVKRSDLDASYVKRTELESRYVKRSELEAIVARLERELAESRSAIHEVQRVAREGGFSIEAILATELELQQQIDAITGAGL